MHAIDRTDAFCERVQATYPGQTVTIGTLIDTCGGDIGLIYRVLGVHPSQFDTHFLYRDALVRVFNKPSS